MNKYLLIIIVISQYLSATSKKINEETIEEMIGDINKCIEKIFDYAQIKIDVNDDYNNTKKIIHKEYEKFKLEHPSSPVEEFYEKIVPLIKNFWKNKQKKHPVGFLLSMEEALYKNIKTNTEWDERKFGDMFVVVTSFKKVFEHYANDGCYEYKEDYCIGNTSYGKGYYFENEHAKIKRLCGEKLLGIAACISFCCFVLPLLIKTTITTYERLTKGRVNHHFESKKRMDKMLVVGGFTGVLFFAIGFGLQICIKKDIVSYDYISKIFKIT